MRVAPPPYAKDFRTADRVISSANFAKSDRLLAPFAAAGPRALL
ncbi:MAG: hypothetical protein M0Z36_09250 [Thermaerobacter sp.]|nr:hypothetical protein [Thermaerobacter sp.]